MSVSVRALAVCAIAASVVGAAQGRLTLAGVVLGAPVQDVMKLYGAPGLVATTDDGIEWRWFDAGGMDVDVLSDDSLAVRQVLVARPQPVKGVQAKLVQPPEAPLLETPVSSASARMTAQGGRRISEPENTISAWRLGPDVLVLEQSGGSVQKILSLDETSAVRFGYVSGPKQAQFRAPRLLREYAVDYPRRALEAHAEGVAVVAVDIAASGQVSAVRIVTSSGNADIDNAEMLSMRRSTFEPARCDGVPCASVYVDREEYSLAP